MKNDQDYSMKQPDLFGNCDPEDAGYATVAENVCGLFSADDGVALMKPRALRLRGFRDRIKISRQTALRGPKTEATYCLRFYKNR